MPGGSRTVSCDRADARARLKTAVAYLETAELVLGEPDRSGFANVAAGNAVLSGIAASDAVSCVRLGRRHRGDDHRGATGLLAGAVPDGSKLATHLSRLLGVKDTGHYGTKLIDVRTARDSIRRASALVDRAREELER
jgi:hypothetical protein